MIKRRIGNDFNLYFNVYRFNGKAVVAEGVIPDGAIAEDLTSAKNIVLKLFNVRCGACAVLDTTINGNEIKAEIPAFIQRLGIHYVVLEYDKTNIEIKDGLQRFTLDCSVFEIVSKSAQANEGDLSVVGFIRAGVDGKPAYQYAKENGYLGTEEEFGRLQYESTLAAINENTRVLSEDQRVLDENGRKLNEEFRTLAEDGRALSENQRKEGYSLMNGRIDGLQSDITWLRDATVVLSINDNNELIADIPNGMTDSYELSESGELMLTY